MRYMGSKAKYAKELLPIILKDRKPGQFYVEPFVGAFNMMDKANGKRIGGDVNEYLMSCYYHLVYNNWIPPDVCTEEQYYHIKNNKDKYPKHLVGFIGFGCAFGGSFFNTYARSKDKKGEPRNYCNESKRNILKQAKTLKGVEIYHSSYDELEIPENSIIYCDPPYANTTKYKNTDTFNNIKFWQWCRDMKSIGHKVFISEYWAPSDFECVWSKEVYSSLGLNTSSKKEVERLFVQKGYWD